jgi:hypothetical protein
MKYNDGSAALTATFICLGAMIGTNNTDIYG